MLLSVCLFSFDCSHRARTDTPVNDSAAIEDVIRGVHFIKPSYIFVNKIGEEYSNMKFIYFQIQTFRRGYMFHSQH